MINSMRSCVIVILLIVMSTSLKAQTLEGAFDYRPYKVGLSASIPTAYNDLNDSYRWLVGVEVSKLFGPIEIGYRIFSLTMNDKLKDDGFSGYDFEMQHLYIDYNLFSKQLKSLVKEKDTFITYIKAGAGYGTAKIDPLKLDGRTVLGELSHSDYTWSIAWGNLKNFSGKKTYFEINYTNFGVEDDRYSVVLITIGTLLDFL